MTVEASLIAAVGERRGVAAADRLCVACVDLFSVDAAAISLVFDGVSTGTIGSSGERARAYDEVQFTVGEGPCLTSVADHAPVLVADLGDPLESRWPMYSPAMLAYDVHGVFAIPVLVAGEYLGALDLFSRRPGALGGQDLSGAVVAAELAEMPVLDLLASELRGAALDPGGDVWRDLATLTRAEVSLATGMLVGAYEVQPAEALLRLRAHAYATGRSTTELARDVVEGRTPLDGSW